MNNYSQEEINAMLPNALEAKMQTNKTNAEENGRKIAVIDSGIGGLLVLEALAKEMPEQEFLYIGDQLHAPYGEKTKEQLLSYTTAILSYVESLGIYRVVIACNTTCATVMDDLVKQFPNLVLYGIVDLTCSQLQVGIHQNILVLATPATVLADAYGKAIRAMHVAMHEVSLAAPKYVVAVEQGQTATQLRAISEEYLTPFIGTIDTVILGCTHFPYVVAYIQEVLGDVIVINSNEVIAKHVAMQEKTRLPLASKASSADQFVFYTTKDVGHFTSQVRALFPKESQIFLLEL